MIVRAGEPTPCALDAVASERFERRVGMALELARRTGRPAFATVTVQVPADLDPAAAVLAARRPDDRFFSFEQPDRDGYAVCGLGAATIVTGSGAARFRDAVRSCRELALRLVRSSSRRCCRS